VLGLRFFILFSEIYLKNTLVCLLRLVLKLDVSSCLRLLAGPWFCTVLAGNKCCCLFHW